MAPAEGTPDPAGDRGLPAGAVAHRLGVAVTTLRSWHQRYGLGPTGHAPGQHRRYTREDLDRLALMLRLTTGGVPPAQAAHRALGAADPGGQPPAGGGPVLAVSQAAQLSRGLGRAALRLDEAAVTRQLDQVLLDLGVVVSWQQVITPVLVGIGERHAATGRLIEVEHLFSSCLRAALSARRSAAPPAADEAAVALLSCADEEQHSLPIEALATALAEVGVPAMVLGARVPPAALTAAARRTGPSAVGLWSHHPDTASAGQLLAVADVTPRSTALLALGPGWLDAQLPDRVHRPATLSAAVALLTMHLR